MYKSLSPTLTALNIDFYNDVACTSCTNASWEVVASKNPDDCQRFETGHHSNYDKLKKAIGEDCILCCWCMIKHCYITSHRTFCDSCTTPKDFSDFINNGS